MDAFLLAGPFDRQAATLEDHATDKIVRVDTDGLEHRYRRRAGEATHHADEPVTLHRAWFVHHSLSDTEGEEAVAALMREQSP